MVFLAVVIPIAIAAATGSYFGPAEFWSFVGVIVALLGVIVAVWTTRKGDKSKKKEDNLSLYINFVDDLQAELRRLQDLMIAERKETQALIREKNDELRQAKIENEKLNMRIMSLTTPRKESTNE